LVGNEALETGKSWSKGKRMAGDRTGGDVLLMPYVPYEITGTDDDDDDVHLSVDLFSLCVLHTTQLAAYIK
jgi:hypothetical protein